MIIICMIKYSFNDNKWIELNSYQGDDNNVKKQILNQSFIIDTWTMNETDGDDDSEGRDYCYYDNWYFIIWISVTNVWL